MRIDKFISNQTSISRKDVRKVLKDKRVIINNEFIVKSDFKFNEDTDLVYLDNELLEYRKFTYILLNKPAGCVSANSDAELPTVFELIDDETSKLVCVGRLDKDTEGLLLITNDGKLNHDLLSPKKHVDKKYYVNIDHQLSKEDIELLTSGTITLDNSVLKPALVEIIDEKSIYLTIYEGKYHQVKRMLEACNNEVTYLKRVSMGKLKLDDDLGLGDYKYLSLDEII
jgi:16S rRNA pseudouridine516 synthase